MTVSSLFCSGRKKHTESDSDRELMGKEAAILKNIYFCPYNESQEHWILLSLNV